MKQLNNTIMAQERYLSPKEILSYLCDLENRLPKRNYRIYVESHRHDDDFGRVTPQEMNEECQRMLEFVGMGDYKADARFVTLDANTAGRTVPGYTPDRKISIEVSDNMTGNWKAVIATLAHEICHQVIHLHGIRPQHLDWMVEAYTDLCTIYVGFGQLILDGYRTNVRRQERTLGYLDWNTYQVTNQMVNVVRGGVHSGNTGLQGSDVFTDEVIQLWESEDKRNKTIKKAFEKRSSTLSDTMRNIAYMENLLMTYREHLKPQASELSQSFVATKEALSNGVDRSLKTFLSLYEAYLICENEGQAEKDGVLEVALYNLYNNVQRRMGKSITLDREIICPYCGKRYKIHDGDGSKKTVKCAQCGTHFVIDTSPWNPQSIRYREEQKRTEKKKKQDAELEELRIKVSGEEKAAAWKENEQLKQDLATIRDGIDHLPRLFRWMLKKYIHKQSSKNVKTITK